MDIVLMRLIAHPDRFEHVGQDREIDARCLAAHEPSLVFEDGCSRN
jgi:hypothetical protein